MTISGPSMAAKTKKNSFFTVLFVRSLARQFIFLGVMKILEFVDAKSKLLASAAGMTVPLVRRTTGQIRSKPK